jgi:hypothetical protein
VLDRHWAVERELDRVAHTMQTELVAPHRQRVPHADAVPVLIRAGTVHGRMCEVSPDRVGGAVEIAVDLDKSRLPRAVGKVLQRR